MAESKLKKLEASLDTAAAYPETTYGIRNSRHTTRELREQLNRQSGRLFGSEMEASVHFMERRWHSEGYQHTDIKDSRFLRAHLIDGHAQMQTDPSQRLIFIHAQDSRSPLKITRLMFLQILAYHQVVPAFLAFTFAFGRQHYVRGLQFSGFRSNSSVSNACARHGMPELGRSGLQLEMCYSLKSVERSSSEHQPWAIRQCSVYHAYDLQHDRTIWIIIKANRVIRRAITQSLEQCSAVACETTSPCARNLTSALAVHETLASWAGENWHWYISALEDQVQVKTRRAVYVPLENTISGSMPKSVASDLKESPRKKLRSLSLDGLKRHVRRSSTLRTWRTGLQTLADDVNDGIEIDSLDTWEPEDPIAIDDFSFADLQNIQHYEERANEALSVLRSNSSVLKDLEREYTNGSLEEKMGQSQADIADFSQAIQGVAKDLALQESRLDSLLRLLADRKTLLQGILQFRSVQATTRLAERAQQSTENMEDMTRDMHAIAAKTKTETVHMRIITIVTMFFLPGTFISTLMSTPLVNFGDDPHASTFSGRNIGVGALQLYLVISLPLLFVTLLTWYGVHAWEQRRERQQLAKEQAKKDCGC